MELAQETRGVREVLRSLRSEQRSGAALLSGGLAYRFFVWLVPFGLVTAAVASFWVHVSRANLEDTARSFGLSGISAHSATGAIEDGYKARWYLLFTGLLLSLWAGVSAVRALKVAARLAWGLEPERLRRPVSAGLAFTSVAVAGLAASVGATWARHHGVLLGLTVTLADVFVFGLLALFAFTHLPRPEGTTWRLQWPGALVVGIGLTGVHVFCAYYLARQLERAPSLYGTLGASTVVLLVLFLIARLLVSGMFLNATLQPPPGDGQPPM